ncbi:MAG: HAD-IC family P-type ATPase, partial [Actinomycetota bacterium]|nr:HAD-IC family P-type ATPase [Actinomycetota bacterium]
MSSPAASTPPEPNGTQTAVVPVSIPDAEHCRSCAERLCETVDGLPGVGSVTVDPAGSSLTVVFDETLTTRETIVTGVERLGHEVAAAIRHASWRVSGLDCPDCARTLDKSVGYLDDVLSATLNFANGVLTVEYEVGSDPREAIIDLVGRMGYGIEPVGDTAGRPVAEFALIGMDCPDCASKLSARIRGWDGVRQADIDFNVARLRVGYDPALTTPERLAEEITRAGYPVEIITKGRVSMQAPSWWRAHRSDVAAVGSGVLIVAAWLTARLTSLDVPVIALYAAAIIIGGTLVFRRAVSSLRVRSLDMNVLMTIAVIGAALIGEWAEGAAVVFLFAIGGMLESRSLARTRRSIRDLMDLTPERARVVRDGETYELMPSEIVVGDTLIVRPGERIPLDGTVTQGSSAVDESPITGESVPVDKEPGMRVFAGSLNTDGVLTLNVTAPAADSTLSRIIYLVEEAQAQQAPFQRLVDRFTRYYTPAVVVFAALVATGPPLLAALIGAPWGDF